ncbi:hypothetical protein J2799_002710 [Chryseobacterium vietnamense]|nr:hypothetical protein [Chryseobacterium vietnamense]
MEFDYKNEYNDNFILKTNSRSTNRVHKYHKEFNRVTKLRFFLRQNDKGQ